MQSVYIMHPYWDESPSVRSHNVEMAGKLATRVLRIGTFAVFSPLQMSKGIECALNEYEWLRHGMFWLAKCDMVVRPDYWERSKGCKSDSAMAEALEMPIFNAEYVAATDYWHVDENAMQGIEAEE